MSFLQISLRCDHHSLQVYLKMSSNKGSKNGIAFFGFGRVGRIHFKSLVRNSRAKILYLIDEVLEPLKEACEEWSLHDSIVIKPQDIDRALKDDR